MLQSIIEDILKPTTDHYLVKDSNFFFKFISDLTRYFINNPGHHLLWVAIIIFTIGLIGVAISRKNLIVVFTSLELMSLGVNMAFVHFSISSDDIIGQVTVFFMLAISAVESAVGLCLLVSYNMLSTRSTDQYFEKIKFKSVGSGNKRKRSRHRKKHANFLF